MLQSQLQWHKLGSIPLRSEQLCQRETHEDRDQLTAIELILIYCSTNQNLVPGFQLDSVHAVGQICLWISKNRYWETDFIGTIPNYSIETSGPETTQCPLSCSQQLRSLRALAQVDQNTQSTPCKSISLSSVVLQVRPIFDHNYFSRGWRR